MRTGAERVEFLALKARELNEHFDSVQIIATLYEARETHIHAAGVGNWYARMGAAREWIMREDEKTRIDARRDRDSEDEKDEEEDAE